MFQRSCAPEDIGDVLKLLQILDSVPRSKRFILSLVADAFINGMNAQEQMNNTRVEE